MTDEPPARPQAPVEPTPADAQWRRLDPRMLLIHPVREIVRAVPWLFGVLIAGSSFGDGERQWLWPLVGAGAVIGFSVLRWFTTTYRFTSEQVQLRTGLVRRNTLAAATEKVRAVDVTAPLLHRVLGLAAVEIGTGAGEKAVKLDGLGAAEAARLRADLLHRSAPTETGAAQANPNGGDAQPEYAAAVDDVLYRFERKWLRYAPLGFAGLATAGVVFGFTVQAVDQLGLRPSRADLPGALNRLEGLGVLSLIALVGVVAIVAVSFFSVAGAALTYYGFTLGRDRAGRTLHLRHGLVTTRSISLEVRRLRGLEVRRPLLLRAAGAARLNAIVTGVQRGEPSTAASTLLAPSSPLPVVTRTGDAVLRTAVVGLPVQPHGATATRRRYTRAVAPAAVLAAVGLALGLWLDLLLSGVVLAVVLLVGAVLLGRSRARMLGHAVTPDHLVTQSGSLAAQRSIVALDGTAAVTVRRSFFQRRAGIATVELALGAGAQGYTVIDLPDEQAEALAGHLLERALRR